MLIFAAVSAPQWFDRDKAGFTDPTLDVSIIGLLTALMVPLQILLIAFAMSGFRQAWNVEVEHEPEDDRGRDDGGGAGARRARRRLPRSSLSPSSPTIGRAPCPGGAQSGRAPSDSKSIVLRGVRVRVPPRAFAAPIPSQCRTPGSDPRRRATDAP